MKMIKEDVGTVLNRAKVIYSDVDATFVHDGCLFLNRQGLTLENAKGIHTLHRYGVDVVMTSGRDREKLTDTARILGFRNFIANLGIEIVYGLGEKVIKNFGVDVPDQTSLKEWIAKSGIIEAIFEAFPGQVSYYKPWSDILRTHHLLIGELKNDEVEKFVSDQFPNLRIIDNGIVSPYEEFSHPHTYHVLPANVGKKSGVGIDKKERGLQAENLLSIGDSLEDVSIAEEVAVFFLLDDTVKTDLENVIVVKNNDGRGFNRIVNFLEKHAFL